MTRRQFLSRIIFHVFNVGLIDYNLSLQQTTNYFTMRSTCLLVLASVVVCNLTGSEGQTILAEDETDPRTIDDIILERAESLLLRSIIRKMQDEDGRNGK